MRRHTNPIKGYHVAGRTYPNTEQTIFVLAGQHRDARRVCVYVGKEKRCPFVADVNRGGQS